MAIRPYSGSGVVVRLRAAPALEKFACQMQTLMRLNQLPLFLHLRDVQYNL